MLADKKAQIIPVQVLLAENLVIPKYQRPYKWIKKNIDDLLTDIEKAILDSENLDETFKYRIGTVILHDTNNGNYSIVDGQQRIISLALLCQVLGKSEYCNSINTPEPDSETKLALSNKITQKNMNENLEVIKDWFISRQKLITPFIKSLNNLLEFVVIKVTDQSEAFQLFDSQNSRGKSLDPHDLLKAYHLREMSENIYEMEDSVRRWESKKSIEIKELFNLYLFPIYNWSEYSYTKEFSAEDIGIYKGVRETLPYSFVKRTLKAMPVFQVTEPFVAGKEFFDFVEHYLTLLNNIQRAFWENEDFKEYRKILGIESSIFQSFQKKEMAYKLGQRYYSYNLFICALLLYYDKFHNLDKTAVKKLFLWAFMIRANMLQLGYDTINKYAKGDSNNLYSNRINVFKSIQRARSHNEISGLQINLNNTRENPSWDDFNNNLKKLNEGKLKK